MLSVGNTCCSALFLRVDGAASLCDAVFFTEPVGSVLVRSACSGPGGVSIFEFQASDATSSATLAGRYERS